MVDKYNKWLFTFLAWSITYSNLTAIFTFRNARMPYVNQGGGTRTVPIPYPTRMRLFFSPSSSLQTKNKQTQSISPALWKMKICLASPIRNI